MKLLLLTLLCVAAFGQDPAGAPGLGKTGPYSCPGITDKAGVLNWPHVTTAMSQLNSAGADVRVLTFDAVPYKNLDLTKTVLLKSCEDWMSGDGGMKNNLIVLMVAVKDHKVGFYYGDQWKPVLDSQYNRIESQQMKPRFRDHDFTGGMVAAMDSTRKLIEASEQPTASSTPVVIQQSSPTDYEGMSHVVWIIVGAGGLCLLIYFAVVWYDGRRKRREAASASKQKAIITQQELVRLLARLNQEMASYAITTNNKERVAWVQSLIDTAASAYSSLKQSGSADPNQEGLAAGEYDSIAYSYGMILGDLQRAERVMTHPEEKAETLTGASEPPAAPPPVRKVPKHTGPTRPTPSRPARVPEPVPVSNSTNIFAPIIINDDEPPYRSEPTPSYHAPDPEPSSSSWGSSDSGGGSSSDWGSSSSDSGSSSDFGSSDSGGGGSSDF